MTEWDKSVDLLIVGSGGGGMVAAQPDFLAVYRAQDVYFVHGDALD